MKEKKADNLLVLLFLEFSRCFHSLSPVTFVLPSFDGSAPLPLHSIYKPSAIWNSTSPRTTTNNTRKSFTGIRPSSPGEINRIASCQIEGPLRKTGRQQWAWWPGSCPCWPPLKKQQQQHLYRAHCFPGHEQQQFRRHNERKLLTTKSVKEEREGEIHTWANVRLFCASSATACPRDDRPCGWEARTSSNDCPLFLFLFVVASR